MNIQIESKEGVISFDVTPFLDYDERKIYFLISTLPQGILLVTKNNTLDGWVQIGNFQFNKAFIKAILIAIDNANFKTLMDDALPVDDLGTYYCEIQKGELMYWVKQK